LIGGRWSPEILAIVATRGSDRLIRPRIAFKITDDIQWRLGLELFSGDKPKGLFSPFSQQDRAVSQLEVRF
jgi:hypothetical protein